MFNPKVSIVIPVYNGSNYLEEAIESALQQTYKNLEIIVVNDGSNDNGKTEAIAKSYGDKIRYFFKENGGVSTALNLGVKKMTGEYFSWLSHDDVYYPNKIEKQIDFLKDNKNKNLIVYSNFDVIDENSDFIREVKIKYVAPEKFRYSLITTGSIHGCSLLIPKKAFEKVGLFNKQYRTIQDKDMWFRISKFFKFELMSEKLIKSREHTLQDSKTPRSKERNSFYISCLKRLTIKELLSAGIYQIKIHNSPKSQSFKKNVIKLFSIFILYAIKTTIPKSVLEKIYFLICSEKHMNDCENWNVINHSIFSIILISLAKTFLPKIIQNKFIFV